jgi:glutaredoxin
MVAKHVKNLLVYGAILAGGWGIGWATPRAVQYFKPAYTEGDYSAYYAGTAVNVLVYGTATCPFCAKTRAYLRAHQIPFADLDVDKSEKGKKDFVALKSPTVPVILIGSRRINGYNESAIVAALEAAAPRAAH